MLDKEIKDNLEKADKSQLNKRKNKIADMICDALMEQNQDIQSKYIPIYKLLKDKLWKV